MPPPQELRNSFLLPRFGRSHSLLSTHHLGRTFSRVTSENYRVNGQKFEAGLVNADRPTSCNKKSASRHPPPAFIVSRLTLLKSGRIDMPRTFAYLFFHRFGKHV